MFLYFVYVQINDSIFLTNICNYRVNLSLFLKVLTKREAMIMMLCLRYGISHYGLKKHSVIRREYG
jgi:hypothetical protein